MFLVDLFLVKFFDLGEWLIFLKSVGFVFCVFKECFRVFVIEVVREVVLVLSDIMFKKLNVLVDYFMN